MKILILKTGELPDHVVLRHGPYERLFMDGVGNGAGFDVADARRGCPQNVGYAGVIVTGSASSVYDGDSWIKRAQDFLKRALEKRIPLYGICFGHQLLAQTLGGRVERCPHGWELGTAGIRLDQEARTDPLFMGLPMEFRAQQSHGDVVTELPSGAVRLAGNSHWHTQAARFGERAWGTQFHPEFTADITADMVESLSPLLPPEALPGLPSGESPRDWILAALEECSHARRCLQNFMKVVLEAWSQGPR